MEMLSNMEGITAADQGFCFFISAEHLGIPDDTSFQRRRRKEEEERACPLSNIAVAKLSMKKNENVNSVQWTTT